MGTGSADGNQEVGPVVHGNEGPAKSHQRHLLREWCQGLTGRNMVEIQSNRRNKAKLGLTRGRRRGEWPNTINVK